MGQVQDQSSVFDTTRQEVEEIWRERTDSAKGAKPVSFKTMTNAKQILSKLAIHFPAANLPEAFAYPDGEVGLDWKAEKGSLSLLIDDRNLYYYWKSRNGKRRKGSNDWDSTIPREILDLFAKLQG